MIFPLKSPIFMPSNGGIPSWGPYSLVAEAPGKNIMVSASIHKDGDTGALIGSIDKCRANRLYEQVGPMEGLISGMENILCGEKVIRLEACFPEGEGSSSQTLKYKKLGYRRISAPDQSMITLSKDINQAQEAVGAEHYAPETETSTSCAPTPTSKKKKMIFPLNAFTNL